MTTNWRRWSGWVGVAVVMLALVAVSAASSASSVRPPPGIRIFPSPLSPGSVGLPPNGVTFRALSCRVDASGFHAAGRVGSWRLFVTIQPFGGYHNYEIEYGDEGPASFQVYGPSHLPPFGFTNLHEPPTDQRRLTAGGGLGFRGGRGRLSLSFVIAYDGRFPRPGIARVLGVASCRYPGRRK